MSSVFSMLLAYHCAPALVGIKSANLISCSIEDYPTLEEDIMDANKKFKGSIKIEILRKSEKSVLILVYYTKALESTLLNPKNHEYLLSIGYPEEFSISSYLDFLKSKISSNINFPHEIGIFLDYELSDVLGFINNEKCLYTGYWKVYSNVEVKKKKFEIYTRCRVALLQKLKKGNMLESIVR